MKVVFVAARARNGVIGNEGTIPWHLPGDFAHFKRVTIGHPLVLGRSTFESIGRPLPGRQSIVLTRDPGWSHDGVWVADSVDRALELAATVDDRVTIGGGAHVYRAALPRATHQILSEIQIEPEGDTVYPHFDEAEWSETERVEHLDEEIPWLIRWLRRR